MREPGPSNLNPEFAKKIADNNIMKPLPTPEVGQIWKHRNGFLYKILAVKIEAAGQLRHQNPSGYLHMYECMRTGKIYARLTDHWEKEMQSFTRVQLARGRAGEVIVVDYDSLTGQGIRAGVDCEPGDTNG